MRHDGLEHLRRKSCKHDQKSCHSFPDLHGCFLMNACEIRDDPNAIVVESSGHEILVCDLHLVRGVEPWGRADVVVVVAVGGEVSTVVLEIFAVVP